MLTIEVSEVLFSAIQITATMSQTHGAGLNRISVTTSALCLRTMNRFAFAQVHCDAVERWNFNDIPAWRKIEDKLTAAAQGGADSDV